VATGEEDLRFAMSGPGKGDPSGKGGANLFFCLCPNANLYISGQLPDPELLIKHGCRIVIGTDSLASNHRLSILEELKTLQRLFPRLATTSLLQWATANGAQALQLDKLLGSFSPGKQPGVLLIEQMEEGRFSEDAKVRRLV
jgi:cytosine/adenosine deaminase-related metal-dependent hydrolase